MDQEEWKSRMRDKISCAEDDGGMRRQGEEADDSALYVSCPRLT